MTQARQVRDTNTSRTLGASAQFCRSRAAHARAASFEIDNAGSRADPLRRWSCPAGDMVYHLNATTGNCGDTKMTSSYMTNAARTKTYLQKAIAYTTSRLHVELHEGTCQDQGYTKQVGTTTYTYSYHVYTVKVWAKGPSTGGKGAQGDACEDKQGFSNQYGSCSTYVTNPYRASRKRLIQSPAPNLPNHTCFAMRLLRGDLSDTSSHALPRSAIGTCPRSGAQAAPRALPGSLPGARLAPMRRRRAAPVAAALRAALHRWRRRRAARSKARRRCTAATTTGLRTRAFARTASGCPASGSLRQDRIARRRTKREV